MIRTSIIEDEDREEKYPMLFTSSASGTVVLATGEGDKNCPYPAFAGVVLSADDDPESPLSVGHYSETWSRGAFVPFRGTIELRND